VTGLDEKTIRRGRDELAASLAECPRIASVALVADAPPKDLTLVPTLQELVAPETAGEPMSGQTCAE
jgi:hypothetical protein